MLLFLIDVGTWVLYFLPAPQSPLESPSTHNQHAPIPYDQLQHHGHQSVGSASPMSPPPVSGVPVLPTGPAPPMDGNKSLPHRSPHPLKSFSVPGPPSHTSAPNTPSQKHIGTGMVSWVRKWNAYFHVSVFFCCEMPINSFPQIFVTIVGHLRIIF